MKHYAIGFPQEDGTMDIDPREWWADDLLELINLAMACEIQGDFEVMEYCEEGYTDEETPWDYNDELRERNLLN